MIRCLLLILFFATPVLAQNLMEERIWKISSRKKSIFLDSGVFHHNSKIGNAQITGIRSSMGPDKSYERVVIDFNTNSIPKVYGHISNNEHKISIDFFETSISSNQTQLKNSVNVKAIDFMSIDGKTTTMNLSLKNKNSFDVFYLDQPGRLVIDIR